MRPLHLFRHRPRYADVASTLALVLAMSGTAYAVTALPAHSVGKKQLKKAAVSNAKLRANSVTSSKVVNNSITLADITGADVKGSATFQVSANACAALSLAVAGAAVGQVAYFSFTGSTVVPPALVLGAMKVSEANKVTAHVCNVGGSTITVDNIGIRIITLG